MLKSQQRLHNNKDFVRVFKQGKRHFSNGILFSYKPNFLKYTRIGFIVSKKYSLSAVRRNKQRRILQSAVRSLYPQLYPGFDIVVSYTNRDKMLPYKEARAVLLAFFIKSNLIK